MNKTKTTDGYTLLTPKFLKVNQCEDDDGLVYYEIGATKWKIRLTEEAFEALKEKVADM